MGGQLVKWYRVPAPSQEAVLSAFEEESWPASIDDPLPIVDNGVPKQRLNNAITRLNGNQENRLILFQADGRGEGIRWKLLMAQPAVARVSAGHPLKTIPETMDVL